MLKPRGLRLIRASLGVIPLTLAAGDAIRIPAVSDPQLESRLFAAEPDIVTPIVMIPADQIVSDTASSVSLMPEGLVDALAVQDFRDLLSFLLSRR